MSTTPPSPDRRPHLDPLLSEFLGMVLETSITDCFVHPVHFNMVWEKDDKHWDWARVKDRWPELESDDCDHDSCDPPLSLGDRARVRDWMTQMERDGWKTCFLPDLKRLSVSSDQTGNDDVRGGGCHGLGLSVDDFYWETERASGLTLQDITEAVYRMKGSKYDWWYELFGSVMFFHDPDDASHLIMEVSFGYGS